MKDTHEEISLPARVPEPGFYYHYKHDPNATDPQHPQCSIQNYAYEVCGLGLYTEDDGPADRFRVEYRPLYPWALVYRLGKLNDHRPVSMFMETVVKDGVDMPRFTKVNDPAVIAQLTAIRDRMYP